MAKNIAQLMLDTLVQAGVERVYGLPGDSLNGFTDSTQALKHDGPALVEVFVHRQELSMPPTISLAQMKGFTLFTLKAVLSGRGEEVVDLAKINLFR